VTACLAMTLVVSGCGGGKKVQAFQPAQVIAFGDENSAFDDTAASGTPLVAVDPSTTAGVTVVTPIQGSRYTINVTSDASFLCKTNRPGDTLPSGCVNNADADITLPTSTSFFVPQSSSFGYRLASGIPIVHKVELGDLTEPITSGSSPTPSPVYLTTDRLYHCSMDFGDYFGNWVQVLVHGLGGGSLSIGGAAGCAQDSGNGKSYAKWGAKVADVEAQKNQHRGELGDGVLVAILAGQNDIWAAYDEVGSATLDREAALVRMRDKGAQLARVINDIVSTGARVVYLTVPDLGKAPKAAGNSTLATDLTKAFNEGYNNEGGLVLTVVTNGHKIVKVDGFTQIANLSASYAVPAAAACETDLAKARTPDGRLLATAYPAITSDADLKAKVLLLNCNSDNLVVLSGNFQASPPTNEIRANFANYLWADGQHLAPVGHSSLGALAVSRVRDQL
jgi:hypothetical protein